MQNEAMSRVGSHALFDYSPCTMSNHKYAYGWIGHILSRQSEIGADDRREAKQANVIAIPDAVFDRIADDMGACKLDRRIKAKQLGWLSIETIYFLATGVSFTEGWTFYGAPFKAAEKGRDATREAAYLAAMEQRYGLKLPPCRPMVGCASEH
jgi:hypothetical protein